MQWLRLLPLLGFVCTAHAMFEDQAGTYDWYKQYVGIPNELAFHKLKPRVYLGTNQNIVSALNLRDGSVAWRRKLEDNDKLDATLLLDTPSVMLSLSSQGTILRAWDQNEGALRWQLNLKKTDSSYKPTLALIPAPEGHTPKVAVVSNGQIEVCKMLQQLHTRERVD